MKIIAPLVLVLLLVPTTKVPAQSNDPLSLLNALVAAEGSRDVEEATALYADDAVITNTRGRKVAAPCPGTRLAIPAPGA